MKRKLHLPTEILSAGKFNESKSQCAQLVRHNIFKHVVTQRASIISVIYERKKRICMWGRIMMEELSFERNRGCIIHM